MSLYTSLEWCLASGLDAPTGASASDPPLKGAMDVDQWDAQCSVDPVRPPTPQHAIFPPPPDVLSRLWEYVETCTPSWLDYGMVAFSKDTVLRHRKRAATVGGLKHRVRLRICTYVPARLLVCTYVPRNPSLWQCYLPPGSGISSRASDSVSAGLPSSSGLSTSCKHVRHGSSTATSPAHFV